MKNLCRLFASALALTALAQAQTTVTNQSGGCSTGIVCALPLVGGTGNITMTAVVGPNCTLGQTCSFPAGYVGTSFAYQWPDGSSGTAPNFSGVMTYTKQGTCGIGCSAYYYTVTGTFSGQDSQGRGFTGSTRQALMITHPSRGGNSAVDTGGTTTLAFTSSPQPTTPPDFSLTATPAALSLQTGQSAVVPLTLVPTGGFSGTETLTCSGQPATINCSFNPPTLVADGSNTPLTTELTITSASTTAIATPSRHWPPSRPIGGAFTLFVLLLPCTLFCWKNKQERKIAHLLIAVLLIAGTGVVSCGGGGGSRPISSAQTPVSPQTSMAASTTVVVTAAGSSGASHSVSINLTMTP